MRGQNERFWQKVHRRSPDECWEWQAAKSDRGYGRAFFDQKMRAAHRVAYMLANGGGHPPSEICVLHSCDNPPCCNPNHLRLGTHQENVDDKMKRRRHVKFSRDTCKWGHEFTGMGATGRRCLTCEKVSRAKRRLLTQDSGAMLGR